MLESTNKQDLSRDSSLKHNEMANNTGNQITDTKM